MPDAPPFPDDLRWRGGCGPGSIDTRLEDGTPVCLRRVTPADEPLIRAGIARMSPHSRYLRFFSGAKEPPDWVIERLLDADGATHIAWGAIALEVEGQPAIGAVHAFREEDEPDCAEFSVGVVDEWHGQGLGKLLTATILLDAREEGIARFHVDTLAENQRAIAFTRNLGGERTGTQGTTMSYTLEVDTALERLEAEADPPGIAAIFAAFRE